jgi:DNA-binding transcriptional ArsR family regulator
MDDKEMPERGIGEDTTDQSPDAGTFIVNSFLLHRLLRMARLVNGDFESLMILGALDLQRTAHSLAARSRLPRIALDDSLFESLLRKQGLRASDLAQLTGVPRETVRRKLERLQAAGRVRRHEDGRWHSCDTGKSVTHAFLRETVDQFRATADLLASPPQA